MEWSIWINFYISIALLPHPFNKESHPGRKEFVKSNLNHIASSLLVFLIWPNSDCEPFSGPDSVRLQLTWIIWANLLILFLVASKGKQGQIGSALFIAQIQRLAKEMLNRRLALRKQHYTYKSLDIARVNDQRIESVIKASGMIEFPAFFWGSSNCIGDYEI